MQTNRIVGGVLLELELSQVKQELSEIKYNLEITKNVCEALKKLRDIIIGETGGLIFCNNGILIQEFTEIENILEKLLLKNTDITKTGLTAKEWLKNFWRKAEEYGIEDVKESEEGATLDLYLSSTPASLYCSSRKTK